MKKLLLGNEAIARGAFEAGARVVSSYPGTPSTEITEFASEYDQIYTEWAPNEKVAFEVCAGASVAGARSMTAMKHVGLNVAADPLFTCSYTGVNGGFCICVADDPGMHSSQNEQDSRHYARAAKLPMLEPANSQECKQFVKLAFSLSEKYDTPVFVRLSTRVSHSKSMVDLQERQELEIKDYQKDPKKYVMMPAMARLRHEIVEDRILALRDYAESAEINKMEINSRKIGVITSGVCYQYTKDALPDASILKLGMVYPLPVKLIRDFASKVDVLYVLEELDPFIEEYVKALGVKVIGKTEDFGFSLLGEYSPQLIKEKVLGQKIGSLDLPDIQAPLRPPVLCSGCPHRGVHYVLNKLKAVVTGDIGCYTLGALPPLQSMDTCLCMGASVSMAHGFAKAQNPKTNNKVVAILGDSTFIHSGITSLIDIVYNQSNATVMILDNSITGMTGHQENPTTGRTIKGQSAPSVDLVALCHSIGVESVTVCDPFDIALLEKTLIQELENPKPSVIIARRPCALLKSVKKQAPVVVDSDKCVGCKMCLKIGCPSISCSSNLDKTEIIINPAQCNGCGLCVKLCKFSALTQG